MKLLGDLIGFVFRCSHQVTTWPFRRENGEEYVACLECGRELPYTTVAEFRRVS